MEELFERLDAQLASQQFKKAARTVDQILSDDPTHEVALHVKGVLLVKTGKHEELLTLVGSERGAAVAQRLAYEKAYCLYRVGRFEEALAALGAVDDSRAVAKLHLQAQVHHRTGNRKECVAAYSELFSKHADQSLELRTNVVAAYVESGRAAEIPELLAAMRVTGSESYEIAFNKACGMIAAGAVGEAEEQLLLAQRIGQETLYSEDFAEEEVAEEVAPLKAQLAYIMCHMRRGSEAAELASEVLKEAKHDPATLAVTENNLVVARAMKVGGKTNYSDSLKRLNAQLAPKSSGKPLALSPELEPRMTDAQKEVLHCNRAILMVAMGRLQQAAELVSALETAFPASVTVAMLRATVLNASGKVAEAEATLATKFPESSPIEPLLLRVQFIASAEPERAADLLDSVADIEFANSPAVIATKLALYKRANATAKADSLLENALHHWERRMTDDENAMVEAMRFLLNAQATLLLEAGRLQDGAQCLMELREKYAPDDLSLLVKLIKIVRTYDPEAAARLGADLPPIESGGQGDQAEIDAVLARVRSRGGDRKKDGEKTKKKRKRKPRLPKGFDPENPGPLDPERWLPKWQRSDFRKKKRGQHQRAQQQSVKGSQGAGKVDENLDRSSAPIADTAPSTTQSQQAKGGKKGKKGKR